MYVCHFQLDDGFLYYLVTFVCWEWDSVVTNQGSRNMVARLNPIRKHIVMKTARLLGTHAITVTAMMKGC
jgi:hypothetical protein